MLIMTMEMEKLLDFMIKYLLIGVSLFITGVASRLTLLTYGVMSQHTADVMYGIAFMMMTCWLIVAHWLWSNGVIDKLDEYDEYMQNL